MLHERREGVATKSNAEGWCPITDAGGRRFAARRTRRKKIGPLDIGRAVLSRCVPLALLPEGVSGEAVALTGCLPSPPVEMKISPRRPDGEEESYFFFFLAAFLAGLAAAAFFFLAMIRSSERKNSVRSLYRSFASSNV